MSSNQNNGYGGDDYTKGVDETAELRSTTLAALKVALEDNQLTSGTTSTIKNSNKQVGAGYAEAQSKCPDLLDDDFYLLFLRCERWNVELAARRVLKYWDERVSLFGPDRAFAPLTAAGALSREEDKKAACLGIFNVLPRRDPDGRSVIWVDASAFPSKHSKEISLKSTCRCMWYAFHAALEGNPDAQRHGVVTLFYNRGAMHLDQFDRQRTKRNIRSIQGCLPVRVKAIHLCQPPTWFAVLAWPLIRLFLGERLRQRVSLHQGTTARVLDALHQNAGLSPDLLPQDIGGQCLWDPVQWFESRKAQGL